MWFETSWSMPVMVGFLAMTVVSLAMASLAMVSVAQGSEEAPSFSHQALTKVLERFVDDKGRVDYKGLAADRAGLDAYIASLAAVSPASQPDLFPTREAAMAYYLNAYNAQVLVSVLRLGPEVESVWPTLWAGYQFFMRHKFTLGGAQFHLKGLEDDQVRAQFKDPRAHAFLNCASISCPRLPPKAIEPATLEEELEAAIREFVNSPQNLRVDADLGTVYLSKIFDWFDKDFLDFERQQGAARPNLIDYVNRYRDPDAQISRDLKIRFLPYDKGLNRQ